MPALRVGIVGLGMMGTRHAQAVAAHPDTSLIAIVEPDRARHRADLGVPMSTDVASLIGAVDAAIVAVPTSLHADVATPLLEAGIACLIEKPLAATASDVARLRAAARDKAVIRVGHIERFNPAVTALLSLSPKDIRAITARRISGASARITDVDVVLDLMVHDIDVVLAVKRQSVIDVKAAGTRDHATALLTFTDGSTATLIASRITPLRIRELEVFTPTAAFQLDYIARSLQEHRGGTAIRHSVAQTDALTAQLSAFVAATRGVATPVTADDAQAALEVVWRIQAALGL